MTEPYVLIVSTSVDSATDAVVQALSARGIVHRRINTEDFPFFKKVTLGCQSGANTTIAFDGRLVAPTSIWYRRFRSPDRPETMDAGIYDFCLRENRAALIGGLLSIRARWMSHPAAIWRAEFKPYQLQIAQELGLRIPRTIVSNDPEAIRRAYRDFGPLIVKPARSGHFREGGGEFSIYTSQISDEHLELLDDARWSPSIYQELVVKRYDVRVTYVGGYIFAAAIHSQADPSAVVDWRKTDDPNLPHSRLILPPKLEDQLLSLMQRLDLQFGCIDLVMTPENEYVFLEVNPNGQWLWLDDQLGFGISDAVAQWLAGRT